MPATQSKVNLASFLFMAFFILVVGLFKLATPFLTVLFAYLILNTFRFWNKKWIAVVLLLIMVGLIFYGFIYFVNEGLVALPKVAATSIPILLAQAKKNGIELPFTDLDSLKAVTVESLSEQLRGLGRFAQLATEEFVFLIIGLVVAITMFFNSRLDLEGGRYQLRDNLYSALCAALAQRFFTFYKSFATVMGAQLLISLFNTFATTILVLILGLPYPQLIISITFLCGLLPIIGNVISNTIICCIALTVAPNLALICLAFLIGIHKLEYFLNSKIIGGRIRNPMWLTLLGLVVGERLLGVPGMILAPVVLNYIKLETSVIPVDRGLHPS
jgi:predicted PurR-regulated permease PerM